ncbi:hypothetical protein [Kaistia sp. MMO-174]|uniref:hypothetical protein n=1 Tax=Kaistia sp. MMO-174 TaxID=3081256 RepID=UPI00301697E8
MAGDEIPPARLLCCVPFCRATRGDRKNDPITASMEWICARHWALVPKRLKRRRAKLRRLTRRGYDDAKAARLDHSVWDQCKRAAIEIAGGIA